MIYDGDSLKQALGLVYGAVAQGLSDEAAIKHASWWMNIAKNELDEFVRSIHPNGFEDERELQKRLLPFEMAERSKVNKVVDAYIRKKGLNEKSVSALWMGITSHFEDMNSGRVLGCLSDRLLFWRRRKLFYVFRAGRAMPMTLKRRHYGSVQAPVDSTEDQEF